MDFHTEAYAERNIADSKIPVFSCKGSCIRGEIARLAAELVAQELEHYARACHAETFSGPDSPMARWVRAADRIVIIDGCFLKCHGGELRKLVDEDKVIHIDAFGPSDHHAGRFLMDDVPEADRKRLARQAADRIIAMLQGGSDRSAALDGYRAMAKELRCWWPNCDALLREDVSAPRAGEPRTEHDHTGYYITCPECGARSYPPQALCCSLEGEAAAAKC